MNSIIQFSHVYKAYKQDKPILKNINLNIHSNEFFLLTGHSGAGKSTLFKLILGLEKISSGQLTVFNKNINFYSDHNIHSLRGRIGVLLQNILLISEINAKENILLPLQHLKLDTKTKNSKLDAVSELLALDKYILESFPSELSGGECQKISLARALINDPELIIADEPTANLDKDYAKLVFEYLFQLKNKTIICSTHDQEFFKNQKHFHHVQLNKGEIMSSEVI